MKTYLIPIISLLLSATSCSEIIDLLPVNNETPCTADTSLRNCSPFPMGAAVSVSRLKNNVDYRDLVIRELNSLTPEVSMKFSRVHPQENLYSWDDADYLVNFAEDHGMRVHGHTLVWHRSIPDWVNNFQGDSTAWDALFKSHIQTVVSRYKGKVSSWDVVNEAIDNDGNGLRPSIWLTKLGPDYIRKAFVYAYEADSSAVLFYNDYGNEYGGKKRNAIINLVNDLKNDGAPIHGVGMQMHTTSWRDTALLRLAIENTAMETGLAIHIAELDVRATKASDADEGFTNEKAVQQADQYAFIVNTYMGLPLNQKFGITTWNVTDRDTWLRSYLGHMEWPLLFDDNYQRKPAYFAIMDLF